jgi:hypothetical protein
MAGQLDGAAAVPVTYPAEPALLPGGGGASRWRWWPVGAMAVAAVALLTFLIYSYNGHTVSFGLFSHPPIYGNWRPVFAPIALVAVAAGVVLAGIAWFATSTRRVPTAAILLLLIVAGVATAATVSLVRGQPGDLWRGVSTNPSAPYYTSDLHFVYENGIRGFVERHPELGGAFHSYSSRTHPPGVLVLLYLLFRAFGQDHPLYVATGIAALAMVSAVCAWSIGRTLGGERAGRIAAVLVVAAPGPLMLAYTNLDVVYATALSGAAALFLIAICRRSAWWAAAAGAVLGFGTFLTYATVFVGLAAAIAVVVQRVGIRATVRIFASAAAGGLAALAVLRVGLGFDLLASYRTVPSADRPYDAYWILGSPAAWLIYAGLVLAGIGVAALWIKVPGARRPVLPIVLITVMVVWAALPPSLTHLRPGEVERTWAFLYPIVAACAAPVVDHWTASRRWRGAIVAALVLVSIAQTVLLQALWDNRF